MNGRISVEQVSLTEN